MTEITIKGYTRKGKNGTMVSVKSYTRRVGKKGVRSPKRTKKSVNPGDELAEKVKQAVLESKPNVKPKYDLAKMTVAEAAAWDKAARKYKNLSIARIQQIEKRKNRWN